MIEIAPEDSISNAGDVHGITPSEAVSDPSSIARSDLSFRSAPGGGRRCFLLGTMLLDAAGRLVRVENLRQHDQIRAATGEILVVTRVACHPGPHQVVGLQVGDASLRMTESHRVMVQRRGRCEPAPANSLRMGEHVVCRLGVLQLAAWPESTTENVAAFEIAFRPNNLAVETFPSVPGNVILTMGSRPRNHHRQRRASRDSESVPPTDDGFEL